MKNIIISFGLMTNTEGILETAYSYDAFGNVSVSGNTETKNSYTYNAEYTDASTGNQQSVPESEIV